MKNTAWIKKLYRTSCKEHYSCPSAMSLSFWHRFSKNSQ